LSAAGTKHHETTTETLANGQQTLIFDDKNGDGNIDRTITTRTNLAEDIYTLGSLITEQSLVDSKWGILESKTHYADADGLGYFTTSSFVVGNFIYDYTVVADTTFGADGRWTTTTTTKDDAFTEIIRRTDIVDQDGLYELHQVNFNVVAGTTWDRSILLQKVADLSATKTSSFWNLSGNLVEKMVETTTANQRTVMLLHDVNGDAINDYRKTATIDLSQNVLTTWEKFSTTGVVTNRVVQSSSGNGMTIEEKVDINADGVFDVRDLITTTVSAANVTTQTVATYFGNTLSENHVTTISANGLTQSELIDYNFGDGVVDEIRTKTTTYNNDGTVSVAEMTTYANGNLRNKSLISTSADERTVTYAYDRDGNGVNDAVTKVVTSTSGDVTTTEQYFNVAGYELVGSKSFTSYDYNEN
jgi:trimeric autotransporter adhesin